MSSTMRALRQRWLREPGQSIQVSINEYFLKRALGTSDPSDPPFDLALLLSGLDYVDEIDGGRDLRGVQIEGGVREFDFSGYDFSFSRLHFNFIRCNLKSARFQSAVLRGQVSVDASGASFEKADLRGVSFLSADLSRALFSDANLANASFEGANLSHADLKRATCRMTSFFGAVMKGCDLRETLLEEAVLQNAIVDASTDFRGAILRDVYDQDLRNKDGMLVGRALDWRCALVDSTTVYEKAGRTIGLS